MEPGKKHYSRVRVDGATVLRDSVGWSKCAVEMLGLELMLKP